MTKNTRNTMTIQGHAALITYDPETELFRGEFTGLNGGADFYAESVAGLRKEGELSLKVFLEMCQEKGLSPTRLCSGKFQMRLTPGPRGPSGCCPWGKPEPACAECPAPDGSNLLGGLFLRPVSRARA